MNIHHRAAALAVGGIAFAFALTGCSVAGGSGSRPDWNSTWLKDGDGKAVERGTAWVSSGGQRMTIREARAVNAKSGTTTRIVANQISFSVSCEQGARLQLEGIGRTVDLTGTCGEVDLSGSDYQLSADAMSKLSDSGSDNSVTAKSLGALDSSGSDLTVKADVVGNIRLSGSNVRITGKTLGDVESSGSDARVDADEVGSLRLSGSDTAVTYGQQRGSREIDGDNRATKR